MVYGISMETYNYVGTGCGQNISVTNQIFESFGNL